LEKSSGRYPISTLIANGSLLNFETGKGDFVPRISPLNLRCFQQQRNFADLQGFNPNTLAKRLDRLLGVLDSMGRKPQTRQANKVVASRSSKGCGKSSTAICFEAILLRLRITSAAPSFTPQAWETCRSVSLRHRLSAWSTTSTLTPQPIPWRT
jgi:hypothetical protein